MKKIFLLIFVNILLQSTLIAQVELKINVLGALLDRPYFAVEYSFTDNTSVELGAGAVFGKTLGGRDQTGANFLLAGKYYFDTRWGIDRYFIGGYLRPQTLLIKNHKDDNFDNANRFSGVATGLLIGRKWASERVCLEVNMGVGKTFGNKIYLYPNPSNILLDNVDTDFLFNVNVGYRFF